MHRNYYQLIITLAAMGFFIPINSVAAGDNRSASNAYEQVESKRSRVGNRNTFSQLTRKPGTNQANSPSRSYKPAPTRSYKPAPTRSYKPAPTRSIKPQTNNRPVRAATKPNKHGKPVATKPSRTASAYSPPNPSYGYKPQTNAYKPQTNGYRPQANPYKKPVKASTRLRNFPNNINTNVNNGQVIHKPTRLHTGSQRNDHTTRGSGNHNNRRPIHHNRPWHLTYYDRYNPNSYPNWFSNHDGYRFAIEQSYSVWQNAYGGAYRPGYYANHLPSYYDRFNWGNNSYYSYGGLYFSYQNHNRRYSLVAAPIGYRISDLPRYAVGFYLGNTLYFNSYNNYYRYLPDRKEYIVVEKPVYDQNDQYVEESFTEPEGGMYLAYNDGGPIYYPNEGQSEAQMSLDLDECHAWSAKETNFDPSLPYPSYDAYKADGFSLALQACMQSRGYIVN